MSVPPSTTSAKDGLPGATELIGTLIGAVVACVAAWKLFAPKFGRIRAIRDAVGYLDLEFRIFYELPQYVLVILTFLILIFLVFWFWGSSYPSAIPAHVPKGLVSVGLSAQTLIGVVILLSIFSAVIYGNLLPRILIGLAALFALTPIRCLQNRYGRNGESIGWHQAVAVMPGPDKGQPLLLDYEKIDFASNEILRRLKGDFRAQDYAEDPRGVSDPVVKANIALFGCITEANYHALGWPSPKWAQFWASLADIQRASSMFAPSELLNFKSGHAFFEAFRERLRLALSARNEPLPPDDALAAASDIADTWDALKSNTRGNTLALIPPIARIVGGSIFWLDKRLRSFPRLKSEGMRPQLIKLLVRWRVLTPTRGIFTQPFAKRQAWLLLQLGVLRALPDMKEITFFSKGQVPIARIAALRVIQRVNELITKGASAEALAVTSELGQSSWNRLQAADTVLWSWANEEASQAAKDEWNKNKWRWKLEAGRAYRIE
jgi:hypothetical protein